MKPQSDTLQHEATYLSPADLQTRWAIGRTMTYETIAGATFPAPLRFGTALRFRLSDVLAWETSMTVAAAPQLPARRAPGRKAVA